MSKRFTENVSLILEKKSKATLRILLEEDEDTGDIFDMGPEKDEEPTKPTKPAETSGEPAAPSEPGEPAAPAKPGETDDITNQQILQTTKKLGDITVAMKKNLSTFGIGFIEDYITSFVSSNVSDNVSENISYENISIKEFLFEKDKTKLEKSLVDYQDTLETAHSYIEDYKLGNNVDIESYVDGAVSALEKFDNLFAKESFVIHAVVNLLILHTKSKAGEYIEEFKDLFAKRLDKAGISYDSRVISNTNYKVAVGGKSQG